MNCKKFEIARTTVVSFVMSGLEFFLLKELQDKILELGGLLRVSSSQTLDQYLDYFERSGFIKYLPKKKGYQVLA